MKRHPTVSEVDIGSPNGSPRLLGDPPRLRRDRDHARVAAEAASC